jgi:hypothetical protein
LCTDVQQSIPAYITHSRCTHTHSSKNKINPLSGPVQEQVLGRIFGIHIASLQLRRTRGRQMATKLRDKPSRMWRGRNWRPVRGCAVLSEREEALGPGHLESKI